MTDAQREKKAEAFARWYVANRDSRLPVMRRYTRAWSLKRRYGISLAEFDALVRAQGRRCALCGKRRRLCVDHDHGIGPIREAVRAAVCRSCNSAIANLFERYGLSRFWELAKAYKPLGLTPDKARFLAEYLRVREATV